MSLLKSEISKFSDHRCPSPGCDLMVRAELLMCQHHWSMVPEKMQGRLTVAWSMFLEGQLEFEEYFKHRQTVIDFVNKKVLTQPI